MDAVGQWAERIARRFTPAEVDFAAEVGIAYAAGGRARKDLLPRYDVQPGAFGPGAAAAELPMILRALGDASAALMYLLRSSYLSNALAAASLLTALRQGRHREPRDEPAAAQPTAEPTEAPPSPPANEKQALEQAFEALSGRLESAGFSPPRAGQLAYGLLEELLSDAAGAVPFLEALTAVPEEGEQRAPGPDTRARRMLRRRKGTR